MNIYIIVDVYPHPFKNYFDTQFGEFINAGHSVHVFSVGKLRGGDYSHLVPKGVKITQLETLRTRPWLIAWQGIKRLFNAPTRSFEAVALGMRHRLGLRETTKLVMWAVQLPAKPPDLFFAHNLAAARRFWFVRELHPDIPYVFYYHGGEVPGVPTIEDEAARRAFSAPDIVFTNTQFSRLDGIKRNCPPEKLCILPVGFRISDYQPQASRPYRQGGTLRFLTLGRASPEKGFSISLEAMRQLVYERGFTGFHYVIVGDGPDLSNMRKLVENYGLSKHVTLFGWATREQVAEQMTLADVFILPSLEINNWSENQACVTQEAMLMRVPVIASTIGGVRESIAPELRGWMFEPGNSAQLADRLIAISKCSAADLEALGRRGREFAERGYDVVTLNQRLLALARTRTPVSEASVVTSSP